MAKSESKTAGDAKKKKKAQAADGAESPAAEEARPISPDERLALYSVRRALPGTLAEKLGLKIKLTTYFQDPFVGLKDKSKALDEEVWVDWEPGLMDGPTSARFAVVDYNADTETLAPPAEWDKDRNTFVSEGIPLNQESVSKFQFHQVSLWALLQKALWFFEDGKGLGRPIPWAFEGNRLIVVPHAGYGENAYYDRNSKSLQFYYFGEEDKRVYTCLSSDIVNHEFAHAVLDGVRPLLNESSSPQTAAFHEYMGDITAILLTLRNNKLRASFAEATQGRLDEAKELSSIAEEFGQATKNRPYLRNADNKTKMSEMANVSEPHDLSTVLTGAMFEILVDIAKGYQKNPEGVGVAEESPNENTTSQKVQSPKQAFWNASERMQRTAIQPLDLLPPVEVTFRDYALAVCRAQKLADPVDPRGYYDRLINVFVEREILSKEEGAALQQPAYLQDRLDLKVQHTIGDISRSRAAAYRFVDDNRKQLLIPRNRDFFIADLYDARKDARQGLALPRQIILEYVWREEVLLDGPEFGDFNGRLTTMLCGGTLVFAENGVVLSWMKKPGSQPWGEAFVRKSKLKTLWEEAVAEGEERKKQLLLGLAKQIAARGIGPAPATAKGMMGSLARPLVAEGDGTMVQFRLAPHLHLSEDSHIHDGDDLGERRWEISC